MAFLDDERLSDLVITKVGKLIDDWKTIAAYFDLSQPEVTEIERNHSNDYGQQKREFLYRWRRKTGDDATLGELRHRLEKAGEKELVRQIVNVGVAGIPEGTPTNQVNMSTTTDSPSEEGKTASPDVIKAVLKKHLPDLATQITNITDFSNRLESVSLIDEDLSEDIMTMTGVGRPEKATRLLKAVQKLLKDSEDPSNHFTKLCEILCRYKTVEATARKMLEEAGIDSTSIQSQPLEKVKAVPIGLAPLKPNSFRNYSEFTVANYGEPKIKDLLSYISEIPDSWENIGIQLEIPQPQLNAIRMNISNGGIAKNFFSDVFDTWKRAANSDCPYSWKTFLEALSSAFVDKALLADHIADDLRSRKH